MVMLGTFAGSSHMLLTVRDQHDTVACLVEWSCPGRNPIILPNKYLFMHMCLSSLCKYIVI
jgi:hypothetical protein